MNMQLFESFRRVDVYAFAMVMWETTRRCMTHEGVEDFALPFHEMVCSKQSCGSGSDPDSYPDPDWIWIRIRIRIGSGFNDFVDPDPDWESGSRIRIRGKKMKKKSTGTFLVDFVYFYNGKV
jgi:hypothetical protein